MKIYHTKTQEDYDALMEELESDGVCWKNGVRAIEYNVWDWLENETCVKFDNEVLAYADIGYYKLEHPDVRIIEYTAKETHDNVNNPSHYTSGKYETIDVIQDSLTKEEFEGFLKGNMLKYTIREREKGGTEDIKKADWYANKLIDVREG